MGLTHSKKWRYILTDMDTVPIVDLEKHARSRSIEYALNQKVTISGVVNSDSPLINGTHTDGFPLLTEGNRLLYAFRRDYDGDPVANDPWTCRAAGIVLELTDNGGENDAQTSFVALDPWQYLYSLPLVNPDHPFDGTYDVTYAATPLNDIVVNLLTNIGFYTTNLGGAAGIDLTGGTIETLPAMTMTFQRETSIGECLDQCCAAGCDIVLTPVYDPIGSPGILCALNIYASAGAEKNIVFGWDKGPRSLVNDNRDIDGTVRQNNIRFHLQAQTDNSEVTVTVTNAASVARFGDYWGTQYFPAAEQTDTIQGYADSVFAEVSEDKRVVSLGPMPERSPEPFVDYYLGDTVKVEASKRLRATQSGFQRIAWFTVEISDDALETVRDLRVYVPAEASS